MTAPPPSGVAAVLNSAPEPARLMLNTLRGWILDEAQRAKVGPLIETLKWGQPSFQTKNRSGTPLRLSWSDRHPDECRLLVHCQTTLVEDWRTRFSGGLRFDGNRAIYLPLAQPLPEAELRHCMAMALTYHKARS